MSQAGYFLLPALLSGADILVFYAKHVCINIIAPFP